MTMFRPSEKEFQSWFASLLARFGGETPRLLNTLHVARLVSLQRFEMFYQRNCAFVHNVAIVSGSELEPELLFVGSGLPVEYLNFEDNPALFDLSLDWRSADWQPFHGRFDLVICAQVLEHLADPSLALRNLEKIVAPGGILHLSTPAVDNKHGEPHHYFGGFAPRTLGMYCQDADFEVIEIGGWCSDLSSRMSATCDWAPISVAGGLAFLIKGLVAIRGDRRSRKKLLRKKVKHFLTYPFQNLFAGFRTTENIAIVWLYARKSAVIGATVPARSDF